MSIDKVPNSMMAVTGVMALLAPLVFMLPNNNGMLSVWLAVYLSIGVIAALGAMIFERSKKSKSKDFSKNVEQNAASTEGVRDPNKLAQIDHMRKEFQRGIDIYKRYGKDLYSLPWYVVVGESGSGKTEALRRSEIGFPDKLQDKWQGSGGTLSMHWWFTTKAVILDTAGRLFVQDGDNAESSRAQWTSFLQMLRKNRPECPINGLILVIPANRLLAGTDPVVEATSVAALDKNAGEISGQLEVLQQELGIRFPVYILISKTDKVTGFREFFSSIERAEERYQMLGWSNPAPLGESFNPQSVTDYIQSVADRLKRRMMSGMRSPVPQQSGSVRIDEVDAMFSFPTAFASMAPKLDRYLRQVFAADEWSARPPFLRGIYFTSALQQGRALDEALAKAMGISLEDMDKDPGDEASGLGTHRTYFIRDLFLEKIFREKGLVTRADKIKSVISGWKLWVPACFLLCLAMIALLGWIFNSPINEPGHWKVLYEARSDVPDRLLHPVATITSIDEKASGRWEENEVLDTLVKLGGDVEGRPKFGWFFAVARLFDRSLAGDRREVFGRISADVVSDLIQQSHDALVIQIDTPPTEQQVRALRALLWLKHGNVKDGQLLLPGQDDEARNLKEVLGSLVGFIDMNREPLKKMAELAEKSAELSDSGFMIALQGHMHEIDLKKMVDESLNPIADYNGDFVRELDKVGELHKEVLEALQGATSVDKERVNKLRSDATRLIENHAKDLGLAQDHEATDKPDEVHGGQSEPITQLEKDVKVLQREEPEIGNYRRIEAEDGSADFSELAKKLLNNEAKLLRDIPNALAPDLTDRRPGFTKSETQELLKLLSDEKCPLRLWWLENEFFPNRFKDYLRFPFVKDARVGSWEEINLLSDLIRVGGKLQNNPLPDSLTQIAGLLLDSESSQLLKVDMNPGDAFGAGATIRVATAAGDKARAFEFDNRDQANLLPAKDVCISSTLSISVQGVSIKKIPGIQNEQWDIVRWYLTDRPANLRNILRIEDQDGRGINLTISRLGDLPDPAQWPTMGDF